jgi:hypothetical protein
MYEGETGVEQTILQVVLRDGQEGVPVQLLQLRRHQVITFSLCNLLKQISIILTRDIQRLPTTPF